MHRACRGWGRATVVYSGTVVFFCFVVVLVVVVVVVVVGVVVVVLGVGVVIVIVVDIDVIKSSHLLFTHANESQ